ncbi:ABC-type transporter, integral membrane subunit [Caldalkalibacillus thermarum TA2.A1]|uniref:ABC-type transporter, integral membrane subunit n=1 Tax=Caldalkalibacillus thermarum (strain TA2.A1) TaxID=986075 RepID=F5L6T9_CALTT|nr:iron ABC transporter permease [Caldalkalibacillus thermarum]EGL82925.1 ABC-type transporter, integral membrane subunit [Caldalkalibacillus thermarum TA2.A1]
MRGILQSKSSKCWGLLVSTVLVVILIGCSIVYGLTEIGWAVAYEAFTNFNGSNEHIIVHQNRLPRALIAAAVGASLAVAGALLQGITRNPLASPSMFGINAGAGFAIVVAVSLFSITSLTAFTWIAFLGAALTACVVYILGSAGRDGLTPIKLTLAGAAMAALFASLTQGLLVLNERALEEVLFWLAGSVEGRKLEALTAVLPYMAGGWAGAMLMAPKMNVLHLGDDVAQGLGQRVWLVKGMAIIIVVLLAGGSVAVAGPIVFIGLVIPHIARGLVGVDYRWLLPYCALLGAMLLLVADIAARYVIMPREVPVGVMTAFIGAPFLIYLARKGVR